jgi:hypothetical protein
MGRIVELHGYDVAPQPLRAGEVVEITSHWRVLGRVPPNLMVWMHLRAEGRPDGPDTRFGDDFALPGLLSDVGPRPQHVTVRRRLLVPAGLVPGRYRLVMGVWDPGSGRRVHRWWRGVVPTLETTVPLGRVEVVRPTP